MITFLKHVFVVLMYKINGFMGFCIWEGAAPTTTLEALVFKNKKSIPLQPPVPLFSFKSILSVSPVLVSLLEEELCVTWLTTQTGTRI